MLFTEPSFLFLFLPLLLGAYFLAPVALRNGVLTVASLGFYALGEPKFLPFMVLSIALNYFLAIWIERARGTHWARTILILGIATDLSLLLVFKYTGWLVENVDHLLAALGLSAIHVPAILLPLGISFFTFHKISYEVDVYRGVTKAQRSPMTLAVYFLFFPQLIAGPIVRYHDIAGQLVSRTVTSGQFAEGCRRLMIGLAKKVIIANTVAIVADGVFKIPHRELSFGVAWLGLLCYTLQIYCDFSGYSDMAIGLAKLFGFRFLENFDHPYASRSITEFWRRWHISLSRWFRDYLYIPLGGNRRGLRRTLINLLIVFFLCGLWHGASWTFVVWGLLHGSFLILERLGLGRLLDRVPRVFSHTYVMLVVMAGWVFFRAGSLDRALGYFRALLGIDSDVPSTYSTDLFLDRWVATILVIGVVASFPVGRWIGEYLARFSPRQSSHLPIHWQVAQAVWLFALLLLSLMLIAAGTYSPFLYSRF